MHKLPLFFGFVISATLSLALAIPRSAEVHKYDGPVNEGRYIVKLRDDTEATVITDILGLLDGIAGVLVTHTWKSLFNGFAGTFDDNAIETLKSNPHVEYIAEDGFMSAFDLQTDAPWNLARVSTRDKLAKQEPLDLDYKYYYEEVFLPTCNVDIYVVDTGIHIEHPDFGGRARWGGTFCKGCGDEDGDGHGTHVAGTAGGERFGVAKTVNLVAVKVLNDTGVGTVSDIIDGLEWVRNQHDPISRQSIATMSLGGARSAPLDDAVKKLIADGIYCTVAAGNFGVDASKTSPAGVTEAITVGATDITDSRAFYSNFGPVVDIFAPGSNVTSAWNDGGIKTISGTSMATPAVAGLVAYYLGTAYGLAIQSPEAMSAFIKSQATEGKLSNIPSGTANLLAFNDYQSWWN